MDSAHWPQVLVKTMEEESTRPILERKAKPGKDQTLNCPRCNSTNTKFCYYNNYSLSQPRYFCKSCRRYWTAGGSLRNIPVGGASRKNKRSTSATSISAPSASSAKKKEVTDGDLNATGSPSISSSSSLLSEMDQMLRIGMSSREPIPFMPMPAVPDSNSMCSSLHGFKPSFDLSPEGFESEPSAARSLFAVEDFKQVPVMDSEGDQNGGKLGDVSGFWNGFFGGGSW